MTPNAQTAWAKSGRGAIARRGQRRCSAWLCGLVVLGIGSVARAEGDGADHRGHVHAAGEEPAVDKAVQLARRQLESVQKLLLAGDLRNAERLLAPLKKSKLVAAVDVSALQGLIDLQLERYDRAARHFRDVLARRATKTAVWLYLGQALYGKKDYKGALRALHRGKKAGVKLPGFWILVTRCYLQLGQPQNAFVMLEAAAQRFQNQQIARDRVLVLVKLGLFSAALAHGRRYLKQVPNDPYGYLMLGEALRQAGARSQAIAIFERGRLLFPANVEIVARLAHSYARGNMPATAAKLFAEASLLDGQYTYEAAEQYRLARKFGMALRHNARLKGATRQLKQRLAILVAAERWQLAAAISRQLQQGGPLDQLSRYLVAYAQLRAGQLARAKATALAIHNGPYQQSAARLLEAIASCQRAPGRCL